MFSYGVNWHSTTSATFLWNYHFTCIQIIFILPLCTFHILRICDDYHHFPLTTRSHSNWPYEFGLRWLMPGPVLSRFDQFLLIGPRTEGGPALRLLTKANFTFYRSCLCIVSARGSVFSKLLWETQTVLTFFQRSLKIKYKLALLPPSKYTKTFHYNHHGIQMYQIHSVAVDRSFNLPIGRRTLYHWAIAVTNKGYGINVTGWHRNFCDIA